MSEFDVDVAIIGAGSAGMTAYREARKFTKSIAFIEQGEFGTMCAREGCMPSKLLIAAANSAYSARVSGAFGIHCKDITIDDEAVLTRVRSERDRFVGFVLDSIEEFEQSHIHKASAEFVDDHTLLLNGTERLSARSIIIATGSQPYIPAILEPVGDRLITNVDVFNWTKLPESVAVFGAGAIGLELCQALHRLGVRTHLFGRDHQVGILTDPVLAALARKHLETEFPIEWHTDVKIEQSGQGISITWDGEIGEQVEEFEFVLAATGRRPNLAHLKLENTSLELGDDGIPVFDPFSMRAGESSIYIIGDVTGQLALLHEAADEGRLAGENAARFPESYRRARRTPLGIVFCSPQIAVVGASYEQLSQKGIAFETGTVSFDDQGRARVDARNAGALNIYGETETGRILGAEMVGPAAEHLAHLLAWAIESRLTVSEALIRPFYHPVLEEGVRTALRNLNFALGFGPNPPLRCIDCGPGG